MQKTLFNCKKCGCTTLTVRSAFCSADFHLVCQGQDPIPGCGEILTAEERHYYGSSCENCQTAWADRIDAWRHGAVDEILDEKYGAPGRARH